MWQALNLSFSDFRYRGGTLRKLEILNHLGSMVQEIKLGMASMELQVFGSCLHAIRYVIENSSWMFRIVFWIRLI